MRRNTFKRGFKPHYERIWNTWDNREKPFWDICFIEKVGSYKIVTKNGNLTYKKKHGMNFIQRTNILYALGSFGIKILLDELN